ncbi:MAG: nodulation protein NfeD [Pseudomonadota bacterium]
MRHQRRPSVGRLGVFSIIFAFAAAALGWSAFAQNASENTSENSTTREGVILTMNGAVSPPVAEYLSREIAEASDAGAELVIIEIDTPGGLVDSMKTIIKSILASETPVATFVSPQGARSASAGLYIMYSAHISAMAPATNTGAATPVTVGGGEPSDDNPFEEDPFGSSDDSEEAADGEEARGTEEGAGGAVSDETVEAAEEAIDELGDAGPMASPEERPLSNDDALRAKAINDSVAYIRALAEERGRNADWAEAAVRDAVSITSREALELGVIDIVADNIDDLLTQIDGKTVKVASGEKTVNTENIQLRRAEPTTVERILSFIADPNVAVILMSLATTGIIIEMWNPGSIFPGALGLICLVLGFYSFQVLPFNWLGLVLMGVGVIFMAVEAYTPTFGLIGLAGLITFGFGLFVVFPEGFRVSAAVIGTIMATAGGFLALVLMAIVGSRSHGPMIGGEAIRKREGVVDDWDGKEGWVIVEGERWRARADRPLSPGDKIRVVEIDGLVLVVKQAKAGSLLNAFTPSEA